ncbi:hypothetical protein GIB67_022143 [Kingdonia uniflora]|uniref:RRM domain-containing protein n=1 Tax=Kingdonia uniflora TaxID=39325 RepID=A0A7J7N9K9_9MAGN|nr:hypothetical protein GIB67_022143 [Kingdonia uniflora]
MSSALDMSLDDMIKNNKKARPGPGGEGARPRGSGPGGPARRNTNRGANRNTPYSSSNMGKLMNQAPPDSLWQHDMFVDQSVAAAFPMAAAVQGARSSAIETGTKLYISNLDYGVSNEDIKELFSEVGDLKRYSVHYDRSGRSKGTAEVVFSRRNDAASAVKRYNNVQLDGKPMKIEIVGTNILTPGALPPPTNGILGNPNAFPRREPKMFIRNGSSREFDSENNLVLCRCGKLIPLSCARCGKLIPLSGASSGQGRIAAMNRARGGGSGGRGFGRGRGGRGRGRSDKEPVSAKDLDADLEKYHSESMQIN